MHDIPEVDMLRFHANLKNFENIMQAAAIFCKSEQKKNCFIQTIFLVLSKWN